MCCVGTAAPGCLLTAILIESERIRTTIITSNVTRATISKNYTTFFKAVDAPNHILNDITAPEQRHKSAKS